MRLVERRGAMNVRSWRWLAAFLSLLVTTISLPDAAQPQATKQTAATAVDDEEDADDQPASSADQQRTDLELGERKAALQGIRRARGQVYPDLEKLKAAGERNIFDPRHDFIGASFYRAGKVADETLELLARFPEIERVQLNEAEISDFALVRLAPLRRLRRLDLDKSSISDAGLAHLAQLRQLRQLGLSDTTITDAGLENVAELRRLESLSLDHTAITGAGLTHLKGIRNLQDLSLQGTKADDEGLAYIARLPKLRGLNLNGTTIGDAGLAGLRDMLSLQSLSLRATMVTDAGFAHLARLPNLKSLDIRETHIGDAAFKQLTGPTKFGELYLGDTQIGDETAETVGRCTDLIYLDLGGTRVTDVGVGQLASLTKLKILNLRCTRITDAGLAHLASFDKLEWLSVAQTGVTDGGIEHLRPMAALRFLDLTGTQIADPQLEPLRALPVLVDLNVDGTRVTAFDKLRSLPRTSRNVQKILQTLDEVTELDFTDQPISDVIDYLRNKHEIEIRFDRRSLDKLGVRTFAPITIRLEGVTLRKALEAILDPLGLSIGIRHEVLMIAAKRFPESPLDLPESAPGQRLSPKLAAALMEPCFLSNKERLSELLREIHEIYKIDVRLDDDALADTDVGPFAIPGVISLKSGLELILGELDMTAVADGDALVIRRHIAKGAPN
jgi:Leucine-rich repeat (LRR) protein